MEQIRHKNNASYIPSLTGLRAIAAFAVYFHHFPLSPFIFGNWVEKFSLELYIGVSIFFVLSGFLITLRYEEKFQNGHRGFKRYFVNRFARIFPLYFILTTLTFILPYWFALPPDDLSAVSYILNITLLKAYSDIYIHAGISQGWTLTVEETFYLLAPVFFIYAGKIKYWMWIILLLIAGFLLTLIFSKIHFLSFFPNYLFTLGNTFFGRGFEFFIGVYLAHIYRAVPVQASLKRFTGYTITGALAITGVVILLMYTGISEHVKYGKSSFSGTLINNFILPPGIGIFMYGLLSEKTIFRKLLETKLFQLLGKSSYAFYLIHAGVIQFFLRKYVIDVTAITFVILVMLSVVIYKFVEEPLNKLIKRLSLKPAASQL